MPLPPKLRPSRKGLAGVKRPRWAGARGSAVEALKGEAVFKGGGEKGDGSSVELCDVVVLLLKEFFGWSSFSDDRRTMIRRTAS